MQPDDLVRSPSRVSAAPCLVIGASHEAALSDAVRQGGRPGFECLNFWSVHYGGGRFPEALADLRARVPQPAAMVLAFGSNAHNRACLIESPEAFFTCDEQGRPVPPDAEGRRFIPRGLLKAHLAADSALLLALVRQVHEAFPGVRAAHLCSPPPVIRLDPVPDADRLPAEQQAFLALLETRPPPLALRMEAWRLQREVFREAAEALGADFLDPPPDALDPDGFLPAALAAHGDPSHANTAYGARVLGQVLPWLEGRA